MKYVRIWMLRLCYLQVLCLSFLRLLRRLSRFATNTEGIRVKTCPIQAAGNVAE